MKPNLALIDGDEVLYRVAYVSEQSTYEAYNISEEMTWASSKSQAKIEKWVNGDDDYVVSRERTLRIGSFEEAEDLFENIIKGIELTTKSNGSLLFFENPNHKNYRHEIATLQKYKDRPTKYGKPLTYWHLREFAQSITEVIIVRPEIETDDCQGIYRYLLDKEYCPIIVSQDKDMNMIPGKHYNAVKKELFEISELDAMKFFYTQILTGDHTDTVPGLYRTLGKRALKSCKQRIQQCETEEEMYDEVLDIYEGNHETVLEIARLLWILREDLKENRSNLWRPPCER